MKYALIVGSHRKDSQSAKVAKVLHRQIQQHDSGANCFTIDLGTQPLPMWDQGVWEGDDRWRAVWSPLSEQLQACDGVFVIAPEYGGMAPPALKNFFLLCTSHKELAHKPAVIVAVSAARGGAYPVSELRSSCYKNNYVNFIPDHLIIRDVETVLNHDDPTSEDDAYIRERIGYTVRMLHQYAIAGKMVRDSGVMKLKDFPNGM